MNYVKVVVFTPCVYYYTIVGLVQWIKAAMDVTYATKIKAYVYLEVKIMDEIMKTEILDKRCRKTRRATSSPTRLRRIPRLSGCVLTLRNTSNARFTRIFPMPSMFMSTIQTKKPPLPTKRSWARSSRSRAILRNTDPLRQRTTCAKCFCRLKSDCLPKSSQFQM